MLNRFLRWLAATVGGMLAWFGILVLVSAAAFSSTPITRGFCAGAAVVWTALATAVAMRIYYRGLAEEHEALYRDRVAAPPAEGVESPPPVPPGWLGQLGGWARALPHR